MNNQNLINSPKYSMRELHTAYKEGKNIIQLLNEGNTETYNLSNKMKHIEIAYDLQAGSYVKAMQNPEHFATKTKKCKKMAEIVSEYISKPRSLLKAGVGEAVTLVPFLNAFESDISFIHGFDISWSRISHARQFLNKNNYQNVDLCTGTLQQIPYVDNAFDVIMTSHACEPNGGYEYLILKELKRVSSNIVALFEPSYEFATEEGKARMIKHGYIKNLPKIAEELGFKVLYHKLMETTMSVNNPTAALILQVPNPEPTRIAPSYACPITKQKLSKIDDGYFSNESFLYFPSIKNMPALREENGILTSSVSNETL